VFDRPLRGVTTIATISVLAIISATGLIYVSLLGFSQTAFTLATYTAVGATLMSVWAWRRWSYGVFLDEGSIKITDSSGTLLIALHDIVRIDVPPSIQIGRHDAPAKCLWIVTRDGAAMETPVVRG
jgi:hypothetical protein